MGRKGMKGFLKGVHKHQSSDDEAADTTPEQPSTTETKTAATPEQPSTENRKQAATDKPADKADGGDDDGDGSGPETRGQMLQRHKREMTAHKKTIQKLGSKKDEAAKLTAEIDARHARELTELDKRQKQQEQQETAATGHGTAEQLAGLELGSTQGGEPKKPTKAQKRREKLAQQDVDREQRIASEQAAMGPSDKAVEEKHLQELLLPLKLGIRDIRADGHCLYRSIEDQLIQAAAAGSRDEAAAGAGGVPDHLALRRLAASHIRSHADEFLPFIYDAEFPGRPEEQLENYCMELEGTAVWGGQLELGALAQALKKQIKVYAADMTVTLGDEHAGEGVLQLCYLRHAFGLGQHYNSLVPLGSGGGTGRSTDRLAE
ncbi:hypothetical protein VaNZ11_014833 [Volvox africanus]|uniref:OTU domain-containing protein n=1 Tax=Volvox africanus TaxID=51714 RepID=A0ABQ5SJC6_9CHLO|nr:hypothetical protein VaNZ11_014833 [Volvox africanus]